MRNAFIDELTALASTHEHVALVVGDLGYDVVEPFAEQFPNRFLNAGVAEQNMTGLAAGMASEGFHVFTYSIANFPTFRCAEQIRNDVAYHRLPVTVVAVGGGLAYGALGYSHHAVQDYALIRPMPGMTVAAPGDPHEVRAAMRHLVAAGSPSYLRLGKAGEPTFHTRVPDVEPGRWVEVRPGDDDQEAILTTGAALRHAVRRWELSTSPRPTVFSMPLWGMSSKTTQAAQAARFAVVRTMEDHLLDGGFGSWLLEALNGDPAFGGRVVCEALDPVVCGTVGSQAMLEELGGLRA